MNKDEIKGIMIACEEMHQYCIKQGMSCENPKEMIGYTKMIVHLTNKFGKYRINND